MALNNFGLGINLNVKGNADKKLPGIGNSFSNLKNKAISGIKTFAKMALVMAPLLITVGALVIGFKLISSTLSDASEASANFEKNFAEITTLLEDNQSSLLPGLKADILDLGQTYGKTMDDMTNATYQAISAGVALADTSEFLGIAGKLAVGGVTDMGTAVDGLTSIKNAWGLNMSEMAGVSDKLFVAMKAGKTTIGELSSSIGGVAPIAAQMGIGLNQVLSMTATLTKGGLNTSEAMIGIKGAMVAVMKGAPEFAKTANKFGIAYDAATVKQMGFANWLGMANTKLTAQGGKMSDLFREVQGLSAALTLTGKGMGTNAIIMDQMADSAGQAEKAFAKISDTYTFKLSQMNAAREKFLVKLGDLFAGSKKSWVELKTSVFDKMSSFIDENIVKIRAIGIMFKMTFSAVKNIVLGAYNFIKNTTSQILTDFDFVFSGIVKLIDMSIAGAKNIFLEFVVGVLMLIEPLRENFMDLFENMKPGLISIFNFVSGIIERIMKIIADVAPFVIRFVVVIAKAILPVFTFIAKSIWGVFTFLVDLIKPVVNIIFGVFEKLIGFIKGVLSGLVGIGEAFGIFEKGSFDYILNGNQNIKQEITGSLTEPQKAISGAWIDSMKQAQRDIANEASEKQTEALLSGMNKNQEENSELLTEGNTIAKNKGIGNELERDLLFRNFNPVKV